MPSSKHNTKSSNPNHPRNTESGNHMRRSFTGNPFSKPSSLMANPRSSFSHTPANSPIDFPRKSFDYEKENVKDQMLKPGKIRSPSPAANSKSSKNFMSPTISASFKIAESPRRKILAERNETVNSSDHKIHIRKVTFADPLEQKRLDASIDGNENPFPSFESDDTSSGNLSDSDAVSLIPKDDLFFENMPMSMNSPLIPQNEIHTETSFENVSIPDFVNLDPTFKLSPPAATPPVSYTHTVINPLDVDPSMPPYDPKTNYLAPTFKLSPPASTPPVSYTHTVIDPPLDADPSVPPYDHKTNYLSPRPQFLHYRPKPQMEDRFIMSASFSDSEVTEDTQSEESLKESEDVSSDETVKQEEELISQPSLVRTLLPEETVEAKELPKKSRFSLISKAVALILLLSIAFISISVINSPGIDHAVFGEFYEAYRLSELSEFARANFDRFSQFSQTNCDGLARNLHIWFTKSLSSITELISDVRGARNLAQLQYFNLTMLNDYTVVKQYPICGCRENEIGITHSHQEQPAASEIAVDEYYEVHEEQLHHDIEMATRFENTLSAPESEEPATIFESEEQALQLSETEHLDAKLAQEVVVEDVPESEEALVEAFKGRSVTSVKPDQALQLIEAAKVENQTPSDAELADEVDIEDAPESEEAFKSVTLVELEQDLQMEETQTPRDDAAAEIRNEEVYGEGSVDTSLAQESDAKFVADIKRSPVSNSEAAEIHTDDKEVGDSASADAAAIRRSEQLLEAGQIPQNTVLYLLLCAGTIVIAGATFNWSRKVKSRSQKPKIESENNQISPVKPSLRNDAPVKKDVVGESSPSEMIGESFPSEMSSFDKSSSYKVSQLNEATSIDKKRRNNYRRESLVSSDSMGSPSYGSLTVFEKIPKGRGDDEIVTPVRRSSRIRSLATSPV